MADTPVSPDDAVARALRALVPGGIRSGELRRGDRALRWIGAGTGAPTIVLEPGAASPATTWAPILVPLAARFRVVLYDRAGYGLSDPPEQLTLDQQIDDLTAIAAETGGGCVVVGHSWGGLLAQLVSWTRPALVSAQHWPRSVPDIARRRDRSGPTEKPVVLLTATKGRPIQDAARVIKLQGTVIEAAGSGRHVVVPDAGHYIHFDRPRLVIQAIDDVVAEASGRYTRRLRAEG